MKFDRKVVSRLDSFAHRHRELKEKVGRARSQFEATCDDRNAAPFAVHVGAMDEAGTAFDASVCGVDLRIRFRPAVTEDSVAVGQLSFYERVASPLEPERYLERVSFNHRGTLEDKADGEEDGADVEYWLFEITLCVAERVLKSRESK